MRSGTRGASAVITEMRLLTASVFALPCSNMPARQGNRSIVGACADALFLHVLAASHAGMLYLHFTCDRVLTLPPRTPSALALPTHFPPLRRILFLVATHH